MIKDETAKVIEHVSSKKKDSYSGFSTSAADRLKRASKGDKEFYFSMLESNEAGLSQEETGERQKVFGLNEIAHEKAPSWYIQLLHAFANLFTGILIVIAVISLVPDNQIH